MNERSVSLKETIISRRKMIAKDIAFRTFGRDILPMWQSLIQSIILRGLLLLAN